MSPQDQIEDWFYRYSDDIHNFLVYYTNSWDVDDLVQDVFIKAMQGIGSFDQRSQVKTWLFTIARRTAIDHIRRRNFLKLVPAVFLQTVVSQEKTPQESIELAEERKQLLAAINQLKRSYREVILLRIIEGLSVQETAEIVEWSENKVSFTLHRALKALQKISTKQGGIVHDVLFQRN